MYNFSPPKLRKFGFKCSRVNYLRINQVTPNWQMDFLNKTRKKGSETEKVNITIKFYMFEIF